MEYIYAALLLHKAGKKVDEHGVKAVLTAAGVAADESRIKALIAALDGVNIEDAIKAAAVVPVAAAAPAAAARMQHPPRKSTRKSTRRKTKRAAWQGSVPCSAKSFLPLSPNYAAEKSALFSIRICQEFPLPNLYCICSRITMCSRVGVSSGQEKAGVS